MTATLVMAAIAIGALLGSLGWVALVSGRGLPDVGDLHDGATRRDTGHDLTSLDGYRAVHRRAEHDCTPPSYRTTGRQP